MSHFHIERKRAAVAVYRHAKRLKTEHGAKWLNPLELAQSAAGGGSRTQIYEWRRSDLSDAAVEQHEEGRGASPCLSEDETSLLVGFACFLRSSQKPVDLKILSQFCTSHLSKTPSPSTISRIMQRFGFSSQKTMTRTSRMVSENVVDAALDAILELRSYEFSPDQLLFMDETGLWSNVAQPKTYHFANWYITQPLLNLTRFFCNQFLGKIFSPRFSTLSPPSNFPSRLFFCISILTLGNNPVVKETGDRFRDTLALTIRGDGVDIPPFFIVHSYKNAPRASGRRCERDEEPVKGINIPRMKQYIDHISQYVTKTSLLVMDRLSSHTSAQIRHYIEAKTLPSGERMFYILLLPAKTAFLISPLDMGAIGAFKAHYHRLDRSTLLKKKNAVKEAWDQVFNDTLLNICRNCGVIGEEPIKSLRQRVLNEVKGLVPEEVEQHLEFYDAWSSGLSHVEGARLGRGVSLEQPLQLPEGNLDGRRWSNFGL
jgi:hypothetical protein